MNTKKTLTKKLLLTLLILTLILATFTLFVGCDETPEKETTTTTISQVAESSVINFVNGSVMEALEEAGIIDGDKVVKFGYELTGNEDDTKVDYVTTISTSKGKGNTHIFKINKVDFIEDIPASAIAKYEENKDKITTIAKTANIRAIKTFEFDGEFDAKYDKLAKDIFAQISNETATDLILKQIGVDKYTLIATTNTGVYTYTVAVENGTAYKDLNDSHKANFKNSFEKQEFTVTFKNYDGEVLKEEQVEKGSNATAPSNVTREADEDYTYTFSGWDKSFNNVQSDLIVTAEFEKTARIYFEVTFMVDNAIYNQKVKVEKDNKVTAPQVPTKDGYIFLGWYTDNNTFLNEFDFDTKITKNITLYANFERDLSNITMQDLLTTYKDEVIANLEPVFDKILQKRFGNSYLDTKQNILNYTWYLGTNLENIQNLNIKFLEQDNNYQTIFVFKVIFPEELKANDLLEKDFNNMQIDRNNIIQTYSFTYEQDKQGDNDALIDAIAKATITDGFDYNAEDTVKLYIYDGSTTTPEYGISLTFKVLLINSTGIREYYITTPQTQHATVEEIIAEIEAGKYQLGFEKKVDFSPNQIEVVCE